MTGRQTRPDDPTPRDGYQPSNWPQMQAQAARGHHSKATGPPPKGPEGGQGDNRGQAAQDRGPTAVPAARSPGKEPRQRPRETEGSARMSNQGDTSQLRLPRGGPGQGHLQDIEEERSVPHQLDRGDSQSVGIGGGHDDPTPGGGGRQGGEVPSQVALGSLSAISAGSIEVDPSRLGTQGAQK